MRTIIVGNMPVSEIRRAFPVTGFPAAAPRTVLSTDLLGAGGELVILHNGREYRLRLTQNGKLILTA
jgi:hemin uptake protein HemP